MRAVRKTYLHLRNSGLQFSAGCLKAADPECVAARQLELLNATWTDAIRHIPFYCDLAEKTSTRDGFASLDHYADIVAVMDKRDVTNVADRSAARFDFSRITGGSSGTPIRLPSWTSEHEHAKEALRVGRFWNGIAPGDTMCLIWGHSHLLGSGWKGALNALVRRGKDAALGYTRISGYDLSNAALEDISRQLTAGRFDVVLGYSRALDALARYARSQGAIWKSGTKAVIATAEALPFCDSREVIEAAFGAPLVMEYGAVETGPVAYTMPNSGYRVLWEQYLIERSNSPARDGEILLTALYPRATPLFRYAIGDTLDGVTQAAGVSVIEFERLGGRSNTPVILPSGRRLHSEVASHVFRAFPSIGQYQLVCRQDYVLGRYFSAADLSEDEMARLCDLAEKIDTEYGKSLRLKRCKFEDLTQAASGKIPFVTYQDGLKP